ncbi:hypothetical protein Glove_152g45 [Diversispora epigaea]|uniref:Uncharacterized protein n=1 Tax=Diversispora epigaea TaxID=1348612 RepID=A0A397IVI1_9GLOM|nr:hypothetical protein Glove_152g45 [Diversispora epigaea]
MHLCNTIVKKRIYDDTSCIVSTGLPRPIILLINNESLIRNDLIEPVKKLFGFLINRLNNKTEYFVNIM